MYLINENLNFVKKNESLFVSLKYLDLQGNLNQIDSASSNILADSNNHGYEVSKNICLLPIPSKGFQDPFRVLPTTSFLCVNIAEDLNIRKYARELTHESPANMVATLEAELKFWIKQEPSEHNSSWRTDPFDLYSNLRSQIFEILEKINIKTTFHMQGSKNEECIIGFKGNNIIDLSDNFILVKYVINNVAANYGLQIVFNKENENNFKLVLLCNNNDGKSFVENFIANNNLISEHNNLLQFNNLNSTSIFRRKLFNDDCKLEIKLTLADNFIPYIHFSLIILYFTNQEEISAWLEEKQFSKFIEDYNKKIIIKLVKKY